MSIRLGSWFALSVILFSLTPQDARASTCEDINDYTPVCIGTLIEFPSLPDGTLSHPGGTSIDPNNDYGTLSNGPNPTWFYFLASSAGTLSIDETNSNNVDVDGAIWGPFDDLNDFPSTCDDTGTTNEWDSVLDSDYLSSADFSFSIPVTAGKYYVLLVTNYAGEATDITLADGGSTATTDCSATCGNGVVEPGEVCDDGNTTTGDGCGATCLLEAGEPCLADPQCQSDDCSIVNSCEDVCGDGFVEGGEACDDGNTTGGDGCAADCSYADNLPNGSSCGTNLECTSGFCDSGTCACDGNDDCLASEVCDSFELPNACEAVNQCGNGTVEAGELCDDGNNTSLDGCSNNCLYETGGTCLLNTDCVGTCIGFFCAPTAGAGGACDGNDNDDCTGALGCNAVGTCGGDGAVCSANENCVNTCIGSVCAPTGTLGGSCDAGDSADCTGVFDCDAAGICGGDGAVCSANGDCVNTCIDAACAPRASVGGSCDAGDGGDCTGALDCDAAGTCGGDGAVCSANGDCINTCIGSACAPTTGVGGTCDAGDDADCAGTPGCDGSGTCGGNGAECAANEDCVNTCIGSACAPAGSVGGTCDAGDTGDCTGALDCDASGMCGGNGAVCSGNADCVNTCIGSLCGSGAATGGTCDTDDDADCASGICVGATCEACEDDQANPDVDNGCDADTPFCLTSGGAGAFECIECVGSNDCGFGSFCNAINACETGCEVNTDCGGGTPACDLSEAAPGVCAVCVNDQAGTAEDNGCSAALGAPLCAISTTAEAFTNGAGTECRACLDSAEGMVGDLGCAGATPFCDVSGSGICLGCVDDSNCPGAQVCAAGSLCMFPDRDGDGIPADVDVDDDNDGVPDDVEGGGIDYSQDGDNDGIPDYSDPDAVSCADGNSDGSCDSLPAVVDLDADGIPNHLDADSDGDGIPDATEAHDADGDGLADAALVMNDADMDGLDDAFDPDCEGLPAGCLADGIGAPTPDSDGDGSADYLDGDSDDDGRSDRQEAFDGNGDGEADILPSGVDADMDGLDDAFDPNQMGMGPTGQDVDGDERPDYVDTDSDGDGITDDAECPDPTNCADSDDDGVIDALDTDSDNDGIADAIEGHDGDADGVPDFAPLDMDDDNDGLDDGYDTDMAGGVVAPLPDSDGNGVPDYQDPGEDDGTDSDGDGISDFVECKNNPATCPDSDGDGLADHLDTDSDGDGIEDAVECGSTPCLDTDGDGAADFQDEDSDDDGLSDLLEGHDANMDGAVDTTPDGSDMDGDGLDDAFDTDNGGTSAPVQDSDSDSTPDFQDADDDNDGIDTTFESNPDHLNVGTAPADTDGDGIPDASECAGGDPVGDRLGCPDTDGDSTPDFEDSDDDNDGIETVNENYDGDGDPSDQDSDLDGIADYLDADDDNDGVTTAEECSNLELDAPTPTTTGSLTTSTYAATALPA